MWTILALGVLGGMWWVAYKMEPHYASKDGRRFMCNAQELADNEPLTRNKETRVVVLADGVLHVSQKSLMRRQASLWTLVGKAPSPPKNLEVYVAQQAQDGQHLARQLFIRVPKKSRVVPVLEAVLAERAVSRTPPSPGTLSPADPPDRG